ncbi:hypothetical protein GYA19_00650 [Candidatus Beckwithbacteria bacterium]|nr:hypothetical protein [Candidatus Beckwithbacteria bacterium]
MNKTIKLLLIIIVLLVLHYFNVKTLFAGCSKYCGFYPQTYCCDSSGTIGGDDPESKACSACSGTQCCGVDGSCGSCGASGNSKGRSVYFFIDNYSPFNFTFPHLVWNDTFKQIWTAEDRVPKFEIDHKNYFPNPYTGDVRIAWWGVDSNHNEDDGSKGFDSYIKKSIQTGPINGKISYSEPQSKSDQTVNYQRVSVLSYPSVLKKQGYRPPGLYTVEPAEDNMSMWIERQDRNGRGLVPIRRAYIKFYLNNYFYRKSEHDFVWYDGAYYFPSPKLPPYYAESDPFVLTKDYSDMDYQIVEDCARDADMIFEDRYYSQLINKTWSSWKKITTSNVSLSAGTYKFKVGFRMIGSGKYGKSCSGVWFDLTTTCKETMEPLTGKLYCAENNKTTTGGRFIRPEDSTINANKQSFTTFEVPGDPSKIRYGFSWNFKPNFTGTYQVRILDHHIPRETSTPQLYIFNDDGSKTDISSQVSATWGQSHNEAPSYRLTIKNLNRYKKYQLKIGSYTSNYNNSFFTFLFADNANGFKEMVRCHDLTCAFLDHEMGIENGVKYMFVPFIQTFICKGNEPENATLCSGDNTGLTADGTNTLVADCTSATKCEYVCDKGYESDGTNCIDPALLNVCTDSVSPLNISNATICPGSDKNLIEDTEKTLVSGLDNCGSKKCVYYCKNDGYYVKNNVCEGCPPAPVINPITGIAEINNFNLSWNWTNPGFSVKELSNVTFDVYMNNSLVESCKNIIALDGSNNYYCDLSQIINTSGTYTFQVVAKNNTGYCADTSLSTSIPETITLNYSSWYQVENGNIHTNNNLSSQVPDNQVFYNPSQSENAGFISYLADIDLGADDSEYDAFQTGNYRIVHEDYAYFLNKMSTDIKSQVQGLSDILVDGIYQTDNTDDLNITATNVNNSKIILFHNGNVNITGNITIQSGSVLMLIVSGEINIDPSVTQIEGIYIANKIKTGTKGLDPSTNLGQDSVLNLNGTFVGWQDFNLQRNLENNSQAAEVFTYRPDLINALRAFDEIKTFQYDWQEIAP